MGQKLKHLLAQQNETEILEYVDKTLLKAYNQGWNDCLWGDDAPALDAQSLNEILNRIKNEPPHNSQKNKWERIDMEHTPGFPVDLQKIYQNTIKFAGEKHADQKIPGSQASYIVHISNVAMEILMAYQATPNFDIQLAVQIALLHDILEDTNTSLQELEEHFGAKIAEACLALSKNKAITDKSERMNDSLKRIRLLDKEVGMVKLADRITNLQPPPKHWSMEKVHNYKNEARVIFEALNHCNEYLASRLISSIKAYNS
ncbi:HD domain-containing protein [uncultured Sunxiuqinia sp.]|uniref:HD domain-containing protein n=1 Tax=uncultured Sunxiuqinia sp. TaxID=1573825 RepID=UPI002602D01D|nr:HD domain-containing protein [uncultured Sunxiuqinia sp.]